ncbi:MAG: hypothetical protein H6828_02445 [Planctomycetes bacterium]|nr:hypothetical protein [Planctomycetota bacterium]
MKPTSLTLLLCVASAPLATAQQDFGQRIAPAPGIKHAGIYHVATGTWTRHASPIALLGADTLYDNTCFIGSYGTQNAGETFVDSGRLPSPSSPTTALSLTGTNTSYLVDGIDIGYCTGEPTIDVNLAFFNCYAACSDATVLVPDAALGISGLPGVGGTGSLGCWFVTLDLAAASAAFNLNADCDGTFDGSASLDNFGWSFEIVTPPASGVNQGPVIAGDPLGLLLGGAGGAGCSYGDGTTWATNGTTEGTGIGTGDTFEVDFAGAPLGCGFYGGYLSGGLYSSFHLELWGDAGGGPPSAGTQYCQGVSCPCGNDSDGSNGFAGCGNGVTTGGASLDGSGNPSVSNDTVVLTANGLQPNQPGLFFRADNAVNGGAGILFGDGLRCAGGNIVRLGVVPSNGSGVASTTGSISAGLGAGDVKRYQYWYRNPANSPCGASFNLTNGFEVTWAN